MGEHNGCTHNFLCVCKIYTHVHTCLMGLSIRQHDTVSDTEETYRGDKTEKEKERVLRRWRSGGRGGEEKGGRVGANEGAPCAACILYREKTTAATRVYTNPRSRESANQEPNGEPLTDSKVRRQSGRFSCLRTPELFGRVFQNFSSRNAFANTFFARDSQSLTHATIEIPRKFGSIGDRIDSRNNSFIQRYENEASHGCQRRVSYLLLRR